MRKSQRSEPCVVTRRIAAKYKELALKNTMRRDDLHVKLAAACEAYDGTPAMFVSIRDTLYKLLEYYSDKHGLRKYRTLCRIPAAILTELRREGFEVEDTGKVIVVTF